MYINPIIDYFILNGSTELSSQFERHISLLTSFIHQQRCNGGAVFDLKLWNYPTSHVRILQIEPSQLT